MAKPDPEFHAMRRIVQILEPLDIAARRRVLAFAASRSEATTETGISFHYPATQMRYTTSGQTSGVDAAR